MGRLTKQQIKEIKESDERQSVLAKRYHVYQNVIKYHRSEEFRNRLRDYNRERYKNLPESKKKDIIMNRKPYQRKYHKKRYNSDENFKEKQKESSRRSNKERYDKAKA